MEKTEKTLAERVAMLNDEKTWQRIRKILDDHDARIEKKAEKKVSRESEKKAIKESRKAIKEKILADMENEKKAILESFKARKREMLNTALKSVSSSMKK